MTSLARCRASLMVVALLVSSTLVLPHDAAAEPPTVEQAKQALHKAIEFFDEQVSVEGGYLYRYTADLQVGEGEGTATRRTAWVQPYGTPSVGMALLDAYRLTGDERALQAARRSGEALLRGQLRSGGWDYRIEFGEERSKYAYRCDIETGGRLRNVTTLDDNTTQAALTFLIELDRALDFRDEWTHEGVKYALRGLLAAQYPNGGWPQRFDAPPEPAKYPALPASYPETWSRTYPAVDYRGHYTFNDNTLADTIGVMFLAAEVYQRDDCRAAAIRGGDFILLAQMPAPQPAWAQQYDAEMHPAWARKFEPPAVTGGESQGVIATLLDLYDRTGERRFLDAIGPALDYLEASRLPDGQLARFYELRTNKPLYFTQKYELTYDDGDLPTHYGFKIGSGLERLRKERDARLADGPRRTSSARELTAPRRSSSLDTQAGAAIASLDDRGAWVEPGRLRYTPEVSAEQVIDTRTFIKQLGVLARYIAAQR